MACIKILFLGKGGTVRGSRLNGEIEHAGGDWMLVRRDGIGLSEIQVLIRTPDGAVAMGEYGGVVDFGADGYAALAAGRGPERAAVQLTPRYVTAAPQLRWLNRLQCLGLGRVTLATLIVEYDLYAMRSRAARPRKETAMPQKVVVLGGGVAGLSAAHQLIERGFSVEVFEKLKIPGGKARSIPVLEGLGHHGGKKEYLAALEAREATPDSQRRRTPRSTASASSRTSTATSPTRCRASRLETGRSSITSWTRRGFWSPATTRPGSNCLRAFPQTSTNSQQRCRRSCGRFRRATTSPTPTSSISRDASGAS